MMLRFDPRIIKMALICFCTVMGQYGLTFWLPSLIRQSGVEGAFHIGLLTAVPFSVAVVSLLVSAGFVSSAALALNATRQNAARAAAIVRII